MLVKEKSVEDELDFDNPIQQEIDFPRAIKYKGQKVWKTGDWFAAAQGPRYLRCLILMDCKNSAFPYFMDRKGRWRMIAGALRNQLASYMESLRNERDFRQIVLDGHLAFRSGETDYIQVDQKWPSNNSLYVDDCYSLAVFKEGRGTKDLGWRRKQLGKIVRGIDSPTLPLVRATKFYRIESRKQFEQMRIDVASVRDWGLMLRRDVPYEAGRTGNLIYVPPED